MGFGGRGDRFAIAKEIAEMKLIGDGQGNVFFNEVLFLAMKRSFFEKLQLQNVTSMEQNQFINNVESDTRLAIERRKFRDLSRKKITLIIEDDKFVNPLY